MSSSIFFLQRIISGPILSASTKSLAQSSLNKCNFITICARESELHPLSQKWILMSLSRQPLISARWYETDTYAIPDYKKHSHSKTWIVERLVSFGLIAAIPGVFTAIPNEHAECLADILVAVHVHWGLEAVFTDYLRPAIVGNIIPKFCDLYAGVISIALAVFLLWVSIHGNGVVKTAKQLWYLDETRE